MGQIPNTTGTCLYFPDFPVILIIALYFENDPWAIGRIVLLYWGIRYHVSRTLVNLVTAECSKLYNRVKFDIIFIYLLSFFLQTK